MNSKNIFNLGLLIFLGILSSCKTPTNTPNNNSTPAYNNINNSSTPSVSPSSVSLNPITSPSVTVEQSSQTDVSSTLNIPSNFLNVSYFDYYSVELKWAQISGAKSYKIYQDGKIIADNLTGSMYKVINLTPNSDYTFDIVAVNNFGESNKSTVKIKTFIPSTNSSSNNYNSTINQINNPQKYNENIIFVNQSLSASGDGTSWGKAYKSLQEALSNNLNNKQIWIAKGTYYPIVATDSNNSRTKSFIIPSGIKIYGGFAGTENNINERNIEANKTILSGDFENDDSIELYQSKTFRVKGSSENLSNNSYHVVKISNDNNKNSTIDGITISSGYADGEGANKDHGGGLLITKASPVINNVTFSNNWALYGGAIFNEDGINTTITNSQFNNNYADNNGGAIYTSNWNLNKMTINISNSKFTDNSADIDGGAIYISNWALSIMKLKYKLSFNIADINNLNTSYNNFTANVSGSIFMNNRAGNQGGGIFNDNSTLNLSTSTFSGNNSSGYGKSIFNFDSEYKSDNNTINSDEISYSPNI